MKKDKGPRFTLTGSTITDRDGITGEVYKEGESWLVRITAAPNIEDKKLLKIAKAMQSWYYYTHVKK